MVMRDDRAKARDEEIARIFEQMSTEERRRQFGNIGHGGFPFFAKGLRRQHDRTRSSRGGWVPDITNLRRIFGFREPPLLFEDGSPVPMYEDGSPMLQYTRTPQRLRRGRPPGGVMPVFPEGQ